MNITLTAVFKKVPEGYVGYVEELPGANTQGETLEETHENLKEAIELVTEADRQLAEESLNWLRQKSAAVPQPREINEFLVRKICQDLDVKKP